jgi:hypothetical protein
LFVLLGGVICVYVPLSFLITAISGSLAQSHQAIGLVFGVLETTLLVSTIPRLIGGRLLGVAVTGVGLLFEFVEVVSDDVVLTVNQTSRGRGVGSPSGGHSFLQQRTGLIGDLKAQLGRDVNFESSEQLSLRLRLTCDRLWCRDGGHRQWWLTFGLKCQGLVG